MTVHTIIHYPDPRLRLTAAPVTTVDNRIRSLIDDLTETMYQAPGVGLSATQIDIHLRVIVVDISPQRNDLHVFVNPKILTLQGSELMDEGCLSFPGIYEPVERAANITVQSLGRDGQDYTLAADGLLAKCIQHEADHLDGKVFIDYLSRMKQQRIKKKLEKQQRLAM